MIRHRFHALCPYFAMFPESFAEYWIQRLTKPDETILDPFSGRGTTALTALLCGRRAISSDVNNVAICLTRAKTNPPSLGRLKSRISELRREFDPKLWAEPAAESDEFFQHAYAPWTLRQLLYLRKSLNWKQSRVDNMLAALTLGSLHGEATSKRYLSNQMPRTISTKPRYSVNFWKMRQLIAPERDVFSILGAMAAFRYESPIPQGDSIVLHTDMRNLPRVIESSPKRPIATWSFIGDMWRCLGAVMSNNAHVVIRIGSRRISPELLERGLTDCGQFSGRKVKLISNRVTEIKKRQTDAFRPGTKGCVVELDCHFRFAD